jgi:hypothetical protein
MSSKEEGSESGTSLEKHETQNSTGQTSLQVGILVFALCVRCDMQSFPDRTSFLRLTVHRRVPFLLPWT